MKPEVEGKVYRLKAGCREFGRVDNKW